MRLLYVGLLLYTITTTITACTKTEDYEHLPLNRITEYKVVNVRDTVIYGSVDNIANTITVYVPYYYGMAVIEPVVKLDEGASLSEELFPVSIQDTTHRYTVKGSDGSTRTYALRIIQQNTPNLVLNWQNANLAKPTKKMPAILGNFLTKSTATLKLELISEATGSIYTFNASQTSIVTEFGLYGEHYALLANLPAETDSGYYKARVQFLGHTTTLSQSLHVGYDQPDIAPAFGVPRTALQGGTISFIPATTVFVNLQSVKVTIKGQVYPLIVQSYTRQQATIKIPEDFPVGDFGDVDFTFQFGNWPAVNFTAPLIVNKKP